MRDVQHLSITALVWELHTRSEADGIDGGNSVFTIAAEKVLITVRAGRSEQPGAQMEIFNHTD